MASRWRYASVPAWPPPPTTRRWQPRSAVLGLARLLSYQVADELWDGKLRVVLAGYEPPPQPIHVIHREGRHAMQKVRAFLDLAIDRLRADKSIN